MKIIIYILFILGFNYISYGQEHVVISGGEITGPSGSVSNSMGQVDYITIEGADGTTTQGVQQPYEIYIVKGKEIKYVNLSAFPNPAHGFVTLNIDGTAEELKTMSYILYDVLGEVLEKSPITANQTGIRLDKYSRNEYMLYVIKNYEPLKTFKIMNFK